MNFRKTLTKFAANQRAIRELSALDDRQLNDLGITRSDIRQAVLGKY